MAFTTGIQALKNAVQEGKDRAAEREASGGGRPFPGYFSWKPGDKKIIRFLTDDIITEDFFTNVICNDGKTRTFLPDPVDGQGRLHRYMSADPGIGWKKEFGGDVVEPYSTRQTVGIAVKREEVLRGDKLVVQDDKTEKEFNNQKYQTLFFGIVQQSISNFWDPLISSVADRYHSICGLDLEVVRTGDSKNTNYGFMPLIVVPELATVEAVQQAYFYGNEWNAEDPDRSLKCPMTLMEWAVYHSSEEYYAKWLTPKDAQASNTPTSPPTGGTNTLSSSGLGEFKASTTSNPADEAQATSGSFASLRQNLIDNAQK
jgi:hypothetical protein